MLNAHLQWFDNVQMSQSFVTSVEPATEAAVSLRSTTYNQRTPPLQKSQPTGNDVTSRLPRQPEVRQVGWYQAATDQL